MELHKEYLDIVLVPSGLLAMFGYHLLLLYKIIRFPHTTVVGYENHNKRAWVERMLQRFEGVHLKKSQDFSLVISDLEDTLQYTIWINDKSIPQPNGVYATNKIPSDSNQMGAPSDTALALQVISSNITASTYLATLSITLSSLIGTWVGNSSSKAMMDSVIYGDRSASTSSVKYITLLSFFFVAFTSFIQSARYFIHANFLMSTLDSDIPVSYVQTAVIRGSNFWSLGLRALYFATTLLLWIFGPIPMFISSLSMVIALHILDTNSTPLHKFRFHSNQALERRVSRQ
ncbi:uncharacterized protein LOC143892015 [Tasmannia lanceolata]|uniref:uncharacterized protein LOC143892015 n=1 Tax=Tasmannia lanceolata TaxID=3420 RepID=UPI0040641089